MPLDITLSPLYRINGQETATMPGLLALTPPRTAARGREQDRLIVYLLLTGNSVFTTTEYLQVAENAAKVFYATTGSLTNALKTATDSINAFLLDRNMSTSSRGQYAIGWLTLAVLRDTQCTLSLSGPMHAFWFGVGESKHFFEPAVSGKGLGSSQTLNIQYGQATLSAGDRLLFCGKIPAAWNTPLSDPNPSSMEATRRRLTTITGEDLNAVLMQATNGTGTLNLLSGTAEIKDEVKREIKQEAPPPPALTRRLPRREGAVFTPEASPTPAPAHVVQPSAYAIPVQQQGNPSAGLPSATSPRGFPSSIPRAGSQPSPAIKNLAADDESEPGQIADKIPAVESKRTVETEVHQAESPREPSQNARRAAKSLANGIQLSRRMSETIGERLKNFLPRLLPNSESTEPAMPSTSLMFIMAILVPIMVVTVASVVYLRYGRSQQYEAYLRQAQEMRNQAVTLTNPVEQRKTWENVLLNVDLAESHRETSETITLRKEAESNLDKLLGIIRLQFNPVFSSRLGIEISRMAASETDLFMLNAANGEVLRAQLTNGRGFQLDTTFTCKPGAYGAYTVGPLVDILAMPALNSIDATLLGIDAGGNLLYCAPGQVAQAIPLAPPDTNWGRVTAFTLDGDNLYVLDAPARAVWVYTGIDGAFIDRPYFFFGGQTPEKQDVIDLVVAGDDLYMLHADGHLSTCSYSRIESVPTRCQDPTPLVNPFGAYQDVDLFSTVHFTQMLFTAPPDQAILILDADTQGVLSFATRTLELQNQLRPTTGAANPVPSGPVGAVTVGPNHVLYLAVGGQVYFATGMP